MWPRFSAILSGADSAEIRLETMFNTVARMHDEAVTAEHLLTASFAEQRELAAQLARYVTAIDHVGFLAPEGISVAAAEKMLVREGFRHGMRTFKSEILARELSLTFGREITATILHGHRRELLEDIGVEVFVAALEPAELLSLLEVEHGCHVALATPTSSLLAEIKHLVNHHGHSEPSIMNQGALSNSSIGSTTLYVDLAGPHGRHGRGNKRLEFIALSRDPR